MRVDELTTRKECYEEDEIDLRELWNTIKKGWRTIAVITFVILFFTFIFVLKTPNSYTSKAILIPTESTKSSGGLGGLAAMAGINLSGGSMTPDVAFSSLLDDYGFMKKFVTENKVFEYYNHPDIDKNYVFAFGFRSLYDLFKTTQNDTKIDQNDIIYDTIKRVSKSLSISTDKKSGLITVAYTDYDRFYAPKIIEMFLKDSSAYLVENNLKNIDKRLNYFQKEMSQIEAFELRQSLSEMISSILKEKVMMKSKEYYQCDILTSPEVPYVKDKTKPKRALILVVAFITSIILGIFLVFFREFLNNK